MRSCRPISCVRQVFGGGTAFWTSSTVDVATNGGVFTTQIQPLTRADSSGKTHVWLEVLVRTVPTSLPRVKLTSATFAIRSDDLTLPFAGSTPASGVAFSVTAAGTAKAGRFAKTIGSQSALEVTADGSGGGAGRAGYFRTDNAANPSATLFATSNGPGRAGHFEVSHSSKFGQALCAGNTGGGEAVHAESFGEGTAVVGIGNGSGHAVEGKSFGTGSAGYFSVQSDTNSPAVYAETRGTGYALYAKSSSPVARAAYFEGNVEVEGKLKTGPAGPSLPIAYGTVSASRTLLSGTDNVSSKWNIASQYYEVTIAGYVYNMYDFVTVVTPVAALRKFTAAYADARGRLLLFVGTRIARGKSDYGLVFASALCGSPPRD